MKEVIRINEALYQAIYTVTQRELTEKRKQLSERNSSARPRLMREIANNEAVLRRLHIAAN